MKGMLRMSLVLRVPSSSTAVRRFLRWLDFWPLEAMKRTKSVPTHVPKVALVLALVKVLVQVLVQVRGVSVLTPTLPLTVS
jgi:hypothetical protein